MKKVWLIGTGLIGVEYSKVLDALQVEHVIIGRGASSAAKFEELRPEKKVIQGGIKNFLKSKPTLPDCVIVAVGFHELFEVTKTLIEYGVKRLFVEKPGAESFEKLQQLNAIAKENHAEIFLGFNRRFYASLLKAEEIIREDGGVTSFNFEFTEWLHVFEAAYGKNIVYNEIYWGNSCHVIDTAFFLGGEPKEMTCYTKTIGNDTFPKIFSGAGISTKGALFSYQANWDAPGRWVVEILTKKHRLYFKPMETLQIQELRSVKVLPVEIDDHLDKEFKPGFYLETKAFLERDDFRFCTLEHQVERINKVFKKISY
jgi:predicted dehydrogenase